MAKNVKSYRATVERDEDGWWIATVHGLPGVHTQAKTLAQVRERVQEALQAARPGAKVKEFRLDPKDMRVLVQRVRVARKVADRKGLEAQKMLRHAARVLDAKGVGRRDAGELLGISFQRVQQLVEQEFEEVAED